MDSAGTLHLACASDDAYAPHSAALLHSALTHRGGRGLHVHFLHGPGLSAGSAELIKEMVVGEGEAISFLAIPEREIAGLPRSEYVSAVMWYRILLPELLPDQDRVLYLDVDTIVTDPLDDLWKADLSGRYVAAVTNVWQNRQEARRPAQLGLAGPDDYFNSGVLLMNLDLMRSDGSTSALRDYARAHRDELPWPDQDTLNVVLGEGRLRLHPRWNCMNSILLFPWSADVFGAEEVAEARRNPAIRHFEGPSINKPWHYLCERDMRELYFEHRRHTPWPDCRLEGRTPANVARRLGRGIKHRLGGRRGVR